MQKAQIPELLIEILVLMYIDVNTISSLLYLIITAHKTPRLYKYCVINCFVIVLGGLGPIHRCSGTRALRRSFRRSITTTGRPAPSATTRRPVPSAFDSAVNVMHDQLFNFCSARSANCLPYLHCSDNNHYDYYTSANM